MNRLCLAAGLVSKALREGHVCFDLASAADATVQIEGEQSPKKLPALLEWIELLKQSGVVGHPDEFCPLILCENRLYTQRFWDYERRLVSSLQARVGFDFKVDDTKKIKDALDAVFPSENADGRTGRKWPRFPRFSTDSPLFREGPGQGKQPRSQESWPFF